MTDLDEYLARMRVMTDLDEYFARMRVITDLDEYFARMREFYTREEALEAAHAALAESGMTRGAGDGEAVVWFGCCDETRAWTIDAPLRMRELRATALRADGALIGEFATQHDAFIAAWEARVMQCCAR
jgi:hypothetical protein